MSAAPTVVVHAGAGVWRAKRELARAACTRAVDAGLVVLADGGSAMDAAIAAVVVLEDDPACNAGTGAVPTTEGTHELDACVMDGRSRTSGAVGALRGYANPILIADAIRREGTMHLLVADGAACFAATLGFGAPADDDPVVTDEAPRERGDTVGAVALDATGALACATSTGGRAGQVPGRIGDTPIVGAGSYADERAACSCTGDGESFVRAVTALWAVDHVARGVASAADEALRRTLDDFRGTGGMILLDASGNIATSRTTEAMPWASGVLGGARLEGL